MEAGVRGFKCFLCPSGVDEFPQVMQNDLDVAYQRLKNSKGTILVILYFRNIEKTAVP